MLSSELCLGLRILQVPSQKMYRAHGRHAMIMVRCTQMWCWPRVRCPIGGAKLAATCTHKEGASNKEECKICSAPYISGSRPVLHRVCFELIAFSMSAQLRARALARVGWLSDESSSLVTTWHFGSSVQFRVSKTLGTYSQCLKNHNVDDELS